MAFDFEIIRPLNYIAHSPPGSISPLLEGLTAFTRATYGCSNALYTYPKTWETELLYIKITITHDVLLIQNIRIPTSFRAPGGWRSADHLTPMLPKLNLSGEVWLQVQLTTKRQKNLDHSKGKSSNYIPNLLDCN